MKNPSTPLKVTTESKVPAPQAEKAVMPKPAAVVKKAAVKSTAKPTAKTAAKPVPPTAKPAIEAKPVKTEKAVKPKKPKLVRDSFTIPKDEYEVIDVLKVRSGKLGQGIKKSELLRAGIKALAAMSDIQFKAALIQVPTIKTGRPTIAK